MTITMYTLNFEWVEFHSGYVLLAIVPPFHSWTWYKTCDQGCFFFLFAVMIACLAALIFMNQISLDIWFNYIDISHLLMALAVYFFLKVACQFNNRQKTGYPFSQELASKVKIKGKTPS